MLNIDNLFSSTILPLERPASRAPSYGPIMVWSPSSPPSMKRVLVVDPVLATAVWWVGRSLALLAQMHCGTFPVSCRRCAAADAGATADDATVPDR